MSTTLTAQQLLRTLPHEWPASLRLAGKKFTLLGVLRHLPGRRIVLHGQTLAGDVVLKVFEAKGKGQQEFFQELAAHQHCVAAGIAVPPIVQQAANQDEVNSISYLFLPAAKTLNELPQSDLPLTKLFQLFAQCHLANCYQQDPHLDNFAWSENQLYLLDLASVVCAQKPLSLSACLENLARLIAQWPVEQEAELLAALPVYFEQRDLSYSAQTQTQFEQKLVKARQQRQRHYLKKQFRNCTMTRYQKTLSIEAAWRKTMTPALAKNPIGALQKAVAAGHPLKKGNSATVLRSKLAGEKVVVKRYNIKNLQHFVNRCLRPSRAQNSWLQANLLEYLGIPTPQPLGFVEQRIFGLRYTAYFICRHIPGRTLLELKEKELQAPEIVQQLADLFAQLRRHRISHGDLKATNFIVDPQGKLWLIDLDAMQQVPAKIFDALHQADQQRFLRNWTTDKHHALLAEAIQA